MARHRSTTRRRGRSRKKYSKKYVPASLSTRDRQKQIRSIRQHSVDPRPHVNYPNRRSRWVLKFQRKYGERDLNWISKHLMKKKGIELILNKGRGAYVSSGSRPNQSMHSWAYARLMSVLMGGPARRVDRKIYEKYKRPALSGGQNRIKVQLKKGTFPKKYTAIFTDAITHKHIKKTHFGDQRYSDYTRHKDRERKERYLNRHRKNEQWSDFTTAGSLSRYILWNKPTISASLQDFKKRFNLV